MSINFTASKTAWDNNVFGNFSKTVTRTPVTRVEDNVSGSETFTEGTPDTAYLAVFFRKEDDWAQEHAGLFENADAVMLIKTSQTVSKDDKITFDGEDYRVEKVTMRYLGTIEFYRVARLVLT